MKTPATTRMPCSAAAAPMVSSPRQSVEYRRTAWKPLAAMLATSAATVAGPLHVPCAV